MHEGLTPDEAEAAIAALTVSYPDAKVTTGTTEDGALFVVAIWTEPNGEIETLTVRRRRARYALLNTDGQPVVEADELDDMLAGAQRDGQ